MLHDVAIRHVLAGVGKMVGVHVASLTRGNVIIHACAGITSAICSQWNHATVAPCHPHTAVGRLSGILWPCTESSCLASRQVYAH